MQSFLKIFINNDFLQKFKVILMRLAIILTIFMVLIVGCSKVPETPIVPVANSTSTVSGVEDLVLNPQDLAQLGLTQDADECPTETYQVSEYSTQAQYNFCNYTVDAINGTVIVVQLQKYADMESLNGSYQYSSLHLRSIDGLLSQDDYGDQSRFYVNSVNDYMGELTDPNITYYSLFFCKDKYLVQVSSSGSKDAKEYVADLGKKILSKFD
jgi:hypothetical protein